MPKTKPESEPGTTLHTQPDSIQGWESDEPESKLQALLFINGASLSSSFSNLFPHK